MKRYFEGKFFFCTETHQLVVHFQNTIFYASEDAVTQKDKLMTLTNKDFNAGNCLVIKIAFNMLKFVSREIIKINYELFDE